VQIKKPGVNSLFIYVLVFFISLVFISQDSKGQIVSGQLLEQLWEANENTKESYVDSLSEVFQGSYISKYISKQIYNGSMLGKLEYPVGEQSKYMPHTFGLKYRVPDYPRIKHQKKEYSSRVFSEHSEHIYRLNKGGSYSSQLKLYQRPILKIMQDASVNYPEYVDYLWNDIPDVSHVGRRRLSRRAVEKRISTFIPDTSSTRPSLEQIIIEKSPWEFGGKENIQLSQGYLENWTKGGESNVALSSDLRLDINFTKGKHSWENKITHKIGVISTESESGRFNDDLVEIDTKYGLQSSKKWYYSFLYNIKTQIFKGYDNSDKEHENPISGFLAPAYMSFAVGMDYKPSNKFTLLLSPLTSRLTIVKDTATIDQTRYGIDANKKANVLNGLSVVNSFSYKVSKEINITSKIDIFYQYLNDNGDNQKQVDWELIMDMRINQFLSTRLLGNLRYFTTESDKVQIRENFNIAFQYHF